MASTSRVLGSVSGLQLALGAFVLSLRLGQVGLLMWQPSDIAHTTSSADPWSMQAVVDWVSQFPVSKVAGWEVLLRCQPGSEVSGPTATVPQAEGERTWV